MLPMVTKGIKGGYIIQLINMQKLLTNIWRIMKIKNDHILNIGM